MADAQTNIQGTQSNPVVVKRRLALSIFSSALGAVVAVVAAPTIAALMPVGAVGFVAGTVTAGVLGSVTTRVARNASGADDATIVIHQRQVQEAYRAVIERYLTSAIDPVIFAIRTNTPFERENRVFFDITHDLRFMNLDTKGRQRMFFDYSFRVVPLNGSDPRPYVDSVPAPDLPVYDQGSTRQATIVAEGGMLRGMPQAVLEGAAFGLVGGGLGGIFPILTRTVFVPTTKGIVVMVGMSSVTGAAGPLKELAFNSGDPYFAALFVEFATEIQHHANRLSHCAMLNDVGLETIMRVGLATDQEARTVGATPGAEGSEHVQFLWQNHDRINIT